MANKKKLSFNDLLMNNKFVFVLSLAAAIFLWAAISMTVGPEEKRVIENVRVQIETSEDSLYKIFGYEETYVDVTVKGKKYLIASGALSASDITVTATNSYVDAAGTHKLKLTASVDKSTEIKIIDISQASIEAFFDIEKTETFPVEADITAEKGIVPEGYLSDEPILPVSSIKVTGPASQINNIEKIKATAKLDETITSTQEFEAKLSAVTQSGKKAKYITYDENIDTISVTVPVLKVETIPVSVRYVNMPSYYEKNMPEVTIFPKEITVAAAQSVIENLETLYVGTIDFSALMNKNNRFTFNLDDIDEVRIIDEISEVTVSVNCYPMSKKTFGVDAVNITLLNVPDGKKAELLTESIRGVTVVGPASDLNKLTEEDIFAKVDLTDASDGTTSYEAVVYVKSSEKCWVYNSYLVKVRVE